MTLKNEGVDNKTGRIGKLDKSFLLNVPSHKRILRDRYGNPITIPIKDKNGIIMTDENGEKITKEVEFSSYDFRNLLGFTDEEIIGKIKQNLGIDIETQEGLDKINNYFKKAIEKFNGSVFRRLFEMKKANFDVIPDIFENKEDILAFLKLTREKQNTPEGELACIITKITHSIANILEYEEDRNYEETKNKVMNFLRQYLGLKEVGNKYIGTICGRKIILHWRSKSLDSMSDKSLGQVHFSSVEKILDRQGFTYELFDSDLIDALKIASDIKLVLETNFGAEIKDVLTKDQNFEKVKGEKEILNNQNLLDLANKTKFFKKSTTSKGYTEYIRMTFCINGLNFEFKFVPHGNKNQDGINFSGIYAYLQKYIEGYVVRHINDGYITEEQLKVVIDSFYVNLQDLINNNPEKIGTSKEEYLKELWDYFQQNGLIMKTAKFDNRSGEKNIEMFLKPGLLKYYKSQLIKMKLKTGEIVWTNERGKILYESGFYEEIEKEAS